MGYVDVADKTTLDAVKKDTSDILASINPGAVIYGVKISKSDSNPATRVTYTHNAIGMTPAHMNYDTGAFDYGSWADVFFVKENYPVMLNYDGTVAYKLDPNDYTKKLDGTESDYANTEFTGNAMSRIPKAYVAMYEDANYEYIQVSNVKVNDKFKAIAHTKEDGTEVDQIFLAMFAGSLVDGKLRSIANQIHIKSKNAAQEIAAAVANNPSVRSDTNGWYTRTWGQRMLINAFLILMGKSTHTQTVFGNGDSSSYVDDASVNYGMVTPGSVETMIKAGQFWGSTDTKLQHKVFHMEDWWGNQWERIAGLINDHGRYKVSLTGPYNTTGAGYDDAGPVSAASNSYIKTNKCDEFGRLPVATGGSASTYDCDYFWTNNEQVDYAIVGGNCGYTSHPAPLGAFSLNVSYAPSRADWYCGACLSFID